MGRRYPAGYYKSPSYLVLDQFTDTRAAGAVNNTAATPGPGTRTVSDTGSLVTVNNGALSLNGGLTTPVQGDPYVRYNAITRTPGCNFSAEFSPVLEKFSFGFDVSGSGAVDYGFTLDNGNITTTSGTDLGVMTGSSSLSVILRRTGYAITNGTKLLWVSDTGNESSLYPLISVYNAVEQVTNVRASTNNLLPLPIISDGFGDIKLVSGNRLSDGLGHLDEGGAGCNVAWVDQTNTAFKNANGVLRAVTLSGSEAYTTIQCGASDVICGAKFTIEADRFCGLILNFVDGSNYVYCKLDRNHINLVKLVSGVATSILTDQDITYVAGAELRIVIDTTAYTVYYNNVKVGTTSTIAGFSGTKFGIFFNTANSNNYCDNFVVYNRSIGATRINKISVVNTYVDPSSYNNHKLLWYKPDDVTVDSSNLVSNWRNSGGLYSQGGNLLPYSEQLGSWTLNNVTATTGQADPWGGTTAVLLTESVDGGSVQHYITTTAATLTPSRTVTYKVYAKDATGGTNGWFPITLQGLDNVQYRAYFNLVSGTVGYKNCAGSSITSVGGGWYLCTATFNTQTGSAACYSTLIVAGDNDSSSYRGNGNPRVYLARASLTDTSWPDQSYYKTGSSPAPVWTSPSNGDLLQSNTSYKPFKSSSGRSGNWLWKTLSAVSLNNVTRTNGFTDAYGGTAASLFVETTANTSHSCYCSAGQTTNNTSDNKTMWISVNVKPFGGVTNILVIKYSKAVGGKGIRFNFTTGEITDYSGSLNRSATQLTDGWWNLKFTISNGVGNNASISWFDILSKSNVPYIGNTNDGFYASHRHVYESDWDPTYVAPNGVYSQPAGINAKSYLLFDGSNDYLQTAGSINFQEPLYVLAAVQEINNINASAGYEPEVLNIAGRDLYFNNAGKYAAYSGAGLSTNASRTQDSTKIIRAIYNGTGSLIEANGSRKIGTLGVSALGTKLTVGAYYNGSTQSLYSNIKFLELIVRTEIPPDDIIKKDINYLRSKYACSYTLDETT